MGNKILIGILVLAVVLIGGMIMLNNKIIALHESCGAAWAQVETVLQRRYDLIPNLVNTVKGYAAHEKTLLEEVTRLRSQWGAARTVEDKTQLSGQLEAGISKLLLVAEQYPDLKASQNFRDLQFELAGTENRISVERQRYNDAIRSYNTAIRQFPGSLVAGMRGLTPTDAYFKSDAPAKEAPKVQF